MTSSGNTALVTKTLVHNASRVVEDPGTLDLPSFLDLCGFMDSCVILDGLQAIESSDVLPSFALSTRLQAEGLLTEFQPTLSRADLQRVAFQLPEVLARQVPGDFWTVPAGQPPEGDDRPPQIIDEAGALRAVEYSDRVGDLYAQLSQMAHLPSLPHGASTQQRLQRSVGYLIVAAANGLDYFPDFDRAPFVKSILDRTYHSLPVQLYQHVAEALGEPLGKDELVAEWTLRTQVSIPPASALVLGRSRSLDEVPERLLEVRSEFADYRRYFADFKVNLQGADTIPERKKLRRRYQELLEMASGPRPEIASAEEMLNFAEKAVALGVAPQMPTSYSALLLLQPIEWIRRWWRQRPLAILFRLDGKLPRLSEYRTLIEKLWGVQISDQILEQYTAHAYAVRHLMTALRPSGALIRSCEQWSQTLETRTTIRYGSRRTLPCRQQRS